MDPYFCFQLTTFVIFTKSANLLVNFILSKANDLNAFIEIEPRVKTICGRPARYNSVHNMVVWKHF